MPRINSGRMNPWVLVAIAAIVKLLTPVIGSVHITLALPCGEQKRQNLGPREMLGDYARNLGSSVRVTRAG